MATRRRVTTGNLRRMTCPGRWYHFPRPFPIPPLAAPGPGSCCPAGRDEWASRACPPGGLAFVADHRHARPAVQDRCQWSRMAVFGQPGAARIVRCITGSCDCYQGRCWLTQRSAGPITGRWCQPRAMTSPRTDSAALRSRWRMTVA